MDDKVTLFSAAKPIGVPAFRVESDWQQKLDVLGSGAQEDVACQTCAANQNAKLVTHHATKPLDVAASSRAFDGRSDLITPENRLTRIKPFALVEDVQNNSRPAWLSSAIRSDGKRIPLVKTLLTNACEKDCYYCPTRRGRNRLRRETFKPNEFAAGFNIIYQRGIAEGLFLSSGIIGGGTRTMEKTIAVFEILRKQYGYRGYGHLKLMPGAERAAIERALQLADRVSLNLEAPNSDRLHKLSGTKQFMDELLVTLRMARELIDADPRLAHKSITTQFVVGGAEENDREILLTSAKLYRQLRVARVYYSAFHPVIDTPLENHAPTPPVREHRLYQGDFLLRQYGFTYSDLVFDAEGNLPTHTDPKTMWAQHHPELFPLELNRASREELLRVPGLGPKSVERIVTHRRASTLHEITELKRFGADAERAAPFILLDGKKPPEQLTLFG